MSREATLKDFDKNFDSAIERFIFESTDSTEASTSIAYSLEEILSKDEKFKYQMLSRMQSDCKYFIGGSRSNKHLWAGSPAEQIEYMKAIWNNLSEKPEWLTMEQINEYEKEMLEINESTALHPTEKGGQEIKLQKIKIKHIDELAKHGTTGILHHSILSEDSELTKEQVESVKKALVEVGNRNMANSRENEKDNKGSTGSDIAEWAVWLASDCMGETADYLVDSVGNRNAKDTYAFSYEKLEKCLMEFYRSEINASNYEEKYDFWSDVIYNKKALGSEQKDSFYILDPKNDKYMFYNKNHGFQWVQFQDEATEFTSHDEAQKFIDEKASHLDGDTKVQIEKVHGGVSWAKAIPMIKDLVKISDDKGEILVEKGVVTLVDRDKAVVTYKNGNEEKKITVPLSQEKAIITVLADIPSDQSALKRCIKCEKKVGENPLIDRDGWACCSKKCLDSSNKASEEDEKFQEEQFGKKS